MESPTSTQALNPMPRAQNSRGGIPGGNLISICRLRSSAYGTTATEPITANATSTAKAFQKRARSLLRAGSAGGGGRSAVEGVRADMGAILVQSDQDAPTPDVAIKCYQDVDVTAIGTRSPP